VEIFNADLWAAPPTKVVNTMVERYLRLVQPYLAEWQMTQSPKQ
jgi:hypothetical protein